MKAAGTTAENQPPRAAQDDDDGWPARSEFRRTVMITAGVHVLVVVLFWAISGRARKEVREEIQWLDGGLLGGGAPAEMLSAPEPEPEPVPEPEPQPEPQPVPEPEPIPLPKATPAAATPKAATPKPATPKPSPPKPTTPKKTTPRPATPRSTPPKATPKATPASAKATPAKATPGPAKASPAGPARAEGEAKSGASAGAGPGKGAEGQGAGAGKPSDFGWYFAGLRDRFYAVWAPPSVPEAGSLVVTLRIRVQRDGKVLGFELIKSSGDSLMDGSVMEAARQVQQLDPLPEGLGTGPVVEIPVNFKPE
jgi:protein TonB